MSAFVLSLNYCIAWSRDINAAINMARVVRHSYATRSCARPPALQRKNIERVWREAKRWARRECLFNFQKRWKLRSLTYWEGSLLIGCWLFFYDRVDENGIRDPHPEDETSGASSCGPHYARYFLPYTRTHVRRRTCPGCGNLLIFPGSSDPISGGWGHANGRDSFPGYSAPSTRSIRQRPTTGWHERPRRGTGQCALQAGV